jgi:hypothetical protein
LTRERNATVAIPVQVASAGNYAIDFRYANGNGPVNTEDKVAVRTVIVDGDTTGVVVLPQRGVNRWAEWGWSNPLHVSLTPGPHTVTIAYTRFDENMNRRENTALLDALRLTWLASPTTRGKRSAAAAGARLRASARLRCSHRATGRHQLEHVGRHRRQRRERDVVGEGAVGGDGEGRAGTPA